MNVKKILASVAVAAVAFVGVAGMAQAADNAATGSAVVADKYAGAYAGYANTKDDSYAGYADDKYSGYADNYAGNGTDKVVRKLSDFSLSAYTPEGKARSLDEVHYGDTLVLEGRNKDNTVRNFAVEIHSNVVKLGNFTVEPGKGVVAKYVVDSKELELGKHHIYNISLDQKDDQTIAEFTIVVNTAYPVLPFQIPVAYL